MAQQRKITYNEYASRLKKLNPSLSAQNLSDERIAKRYLNANPDHRKNIDTQSLNDLYEPGKEARSGEFDFMLFQTKEMLSGVPPAVIGGIAALTKSETLLKISEEKRKEADEASKERIRNDTGIQGYLSWIEDEPATLKSYTQPEMLKRAFSQAVPSLATMIVTDIGLGLATYGAAPIFLRGRKAYKMVKGARETMRGAKAAGKPIPKTAYTDAMKYASRSDKLRRAGTMGTIGVLEGSEQYNSTMSYLVDEKKIDIDQANKIASVAMVAQGAASGILEYIPYGRFKNVVGLGKLDAGILEKRVANALIKRGAGAKGKIITKRMIQGGLIEGATEYAQYMSSALVDYHVKKGFEDVPEEALQELKDAFKSPEARESAFSGSVVGGLFGFGAGVINSSTKRRIQEIRKEGREQGLSKEEISESVAKVVKEEQVKQKEPGKITYAAFTSDFSDLSQQEKDIALQKSDEFRNNPKKANQEILDVAKDDPSVLKNLSEEQMGFVEQNIAINDEPNAESVIKELQQTLSPETVEEQIIDKKPTVDKPIEQKEPVTAKQNIVDEPIDAPQESKARQLPTPKKAKRPKKDLDRVNITYSDGNFNVTVDNKKVKQEVIDKNIDSLQEGIAAVEQGDDKGLDLPKNDILNTVDKPRAEPKPTIEPKQKDKIVDAPVVDEPDEAGARQLPQPKGKKKEVLESLDKIKKEEKVLKAVEAKTKAKNPEVFEDKKPVKETKESVEQQKVESKKALNKKVENEIKTQNISTKIAKEKESKRAVVKQQEQQEQKQGDKSAKKVDTRHKIFQSRQDKDTFKYTDGQKTTLSKIANFLDSDKGDYYVFAGYAGTGKTTIVENISNYLKGNNKKAFIAAPTNKAVARLSEVAKNKYDANFSTLHQILYGEPDPTTGEWISKIDLDPDKNVLVIDEASMIDDSVWKDIQKDVIGKGVKVILIGDGFQLPPVGSDPRLMEQHSQKGSQLLNVVRQAADSAIIKLATALRVARVPIVPESSQGDVEVLPPTEINSLFFNDVKENKDSVMLVGANKMRLALNSQARNVKFGVFANTPLLEGDRLIAVSNSSIRKNGESFVITEKMANSLSGPINVQMKPNLNNPNKIDTVPIYHFVTKYGSNQFLAPNLYGASFHIRQLTDDSLSMLVNSYPDAFQTNDKGQTLPQNDTNINTYGYAITGHKSQGSQWDSVYIGTGFFGDNELQARWLYTAVTRASNKLFLSQSIGGNRVSWARIADAMNVTNQVNNDDVNEKLQELQKGAKISNNKELAAKIAARLKKQFPFITAEGLEKVYNRFGREVAGRAIDGMVEWSLTKGTLDTIPHEYAHIYIDLLRDMPIIKQGIDKFKDEADTLEFAEEKLVQYIGEYYADRIQSESLKKKLGIWLKQFWLSIKKSFANLSKDEIGSYLAEKFYQDSMEKRTITTTGKARYQYISSGSKVYDEVYSTVENGYESFVNQLKYKGLFSQRKINQFEKNDLIASYLSGLKYNQVFEPIVEDWLTDSGFTKDSARIIQSIVDDSVDFFNDFAEIINTELSNISVTDENLKEFNKSNARVLKDLGVFSEGDLQHIYLIASSHLNREGFREIMASKYLKKKVEELTEKEYRQITKIFNSAQSSVKVNGSPELKKYNQVTNLTGQMIIKYDEIEKQYYDPVFTIDEKIDVDIRGKKNPSRDRMFIAKAQGIAFDEIVILKGKDLILKKDRKQFTGKFAGKYILEESQRYDPLTPQQMLDLQKAASKQNLVLVFNKGEKEQFWFARITEQDIELAKNAEDYWKTTPYTQKQIDNFLGKNMKWFSNPNLNKNLLIKWRAGQIARDRFMNQVFPDYLSYDDGAKVFKRLKLPLTPSVHSKEMPSPVVKIFDKNNATFVNKDGKEIDSVSTIGGKKVYRFDGASFGSARLFNNFIEYFGMKKDASKAKSVVHAVLGDADFLFMKHQHFLIKQPISIYENYKKNNQRLVAIITENGEIVDSDNVPIDILATEDEVKIMTDNIKDLMKAGKSFPINGSSIGMIKMPDKRNDSARSSMQLFNYIHDSKVLSAWREEILPIIEKRLTSTVFSIGRIAELNNPSTRISEFFDLLYNNDKNLPDYTFEMFKLGLGLHKFGSKILDKLMQTQYVQDALTLGSMKGLRGDTFVDPTGELEYKEVSVARQDATAIIRDYKKATKNRTARIEDVNKWLNSTDYKMLITRSPVPHINGGAMVRIKSLHDSSGVVFLNPDLLYIDLEGDNDGDSVTLEKLPPKLEKEMVRMYKELKDVKPINLEKYVDKKKKYDLSNTYDLLSLINAVTTGQNAVAEIANIQMVYGMLQETVNAVNVDTKDTNYTLNLRKANQKITDPNSGITDTVDNILRVYLQASVDNVEFLLLNDWNYSKENLLGLLFERSDGSKMSGIDLLIADKLYRKHKVISEIKYGRDYNKGSYSFHDTIEKSQAYLNYVNNKQRNMFDEFANDTRFAGINVRTSFKQNQDGQFATHPHEDIATSVAKKWESYSEEYHNGTPFILDENLYYHAHIKTLNELNEDIINMEDSKEGQRGVTYTNELSIRISELFKNNQERTLDGWNTDNDMLNIVEEFKSKFSELNEVEKRAATLAYFNQGFRIVNGQTRLIAETGTIPPVSENPKGLSLLHAPTVKKYFKIYNNAISEIVKNKEDYNKPINRAKNKIVMSAYLDEDIRKNCT